MAEGRRGTCERQAVGRRCRSVITGKAQGLGKQEQQARTRSHEQRLTIGWYKESDFGWTVVWGHGRVSS